MSKCMSTFAGVSSFSILFFSLRFDLYRPLALFSAAISLHSASRWTPAAFAISVHIQVDLTLAIVPLQAVTVCTQIALSFAIVSIRGMRVTHLHWPPC